MWWIGVLTASATTLHTERLSWAPLRAAWLAAIPAQAYTEALAGQTPTGTASTNAGDQIWAVARLDAPIDAVWRALTDAENFARWMPVDQTVALSRPGQDGAVLFHYLSLPIVTDRFWCVEHDHNAALYAQTSGKVWELSWTEQHGTPACAQLPASSTRGMPVRLSRGSWLLVDLGDNQTLAEYITWAHPGGNLPGDQVARFAASRLSETLSSLQDMARWEQNRPVTGFYRPDGTAMQ
ncbi:MAG: hypothetical protein ACI8S6_003008 [Myxococcota bacterium]|jgi:hypothetical protein